MPAAAQADDAATGAGAPDAAVGKQRIWRRRPLRRLPVRRVILLVVAALVALFLIVSLVAALARALQRDQTQSVQTPATSAGRVAIENDCGSISLREGTSEVVSVQSTIHFLLTKPKLTSQLEGDVVVVAVDCPRFGFGATADLVVDLPPLGAVEVTANSGDIAAEDVSASLSLNSSAGEISAVGLRATAVSAESSAGGVSLTWAEDADPRTIKAISSAGEVNILVPERLGVSYQVNATTAAGDATVDVRTDDSADRTIHATSSAGSVHVGYR